MTHIGLTDEQAVLSREKHGTNMLTRVKRGGFWDKLKKNFGDPMIKILCVALLINIVFAFTGNAHWYETLGIAIAVALATFVSTFSEYRNENAFQKLQEDASKIKCKVYRNGILTELSVDDVVVGDCILLQSGDKIPADGIILTGSINADQSVLNGESKEAEKIPAPKDYTEQDSGMDFLNEYKVFRGTVVCSGNAVMCVKHVGDNTVYGKIASELQQDDERDSPLKVKLLKLAKNISRFGYIGGLAIAAAFLFQRIVMYNHFNINEIMNYCSNPMVIANDFVNAVILAVIIIVMAVPEGLPLMIAIVSALNMGKMLKDNVLVRKISGIETAGSLNILFSDKTGTITKGKLEAVVFADGKGREYKDFDSIPAKLAEVLSLSLHHNTDAVISVRDNNQCILGGNATERAVLGFAAGKSKSKNVTPVQSLPFNSENKFSATTVKGDYNLTLIKGAPEKILPKCSGYFDEDGNLCNTFNPKLVNDTTDSLAQRAIRVLALAVSNRELKENNLPGGDWTLVGIIGIRDEVRPESCTAISRVQNAGVQVVMITGDRKDTAVAIAKEAGLLTQDSHLVLTSDDLQNLSDQELKTMLPDIRVIARALPSDKSRLVKTAQELNLVVGMTGDGVNDSPALKKADVGFAMGGGTEVAKEAGDIVITDDNFSSIDKAILYGRTIFNSIRKFIIFQLTINVAAVLVSFASPLLGFENPPLSITQILWINLVMDTLAALAFGGEPPLSRFMKEKPKRRDEDIISPYMLSSVLTGSLSVFAISMVFLLTDAFDGFFREAPSGKFVLTGYFTFFIFSAVFNALNARTEKVNIFDNIKRNPGFIKIIFLIIAIQIIMTHFGGEVLKSYGLTLSEWVVVLCLSLLIIPVDIFRKFIIYKKQLR